MLPGSLVEKVGPSRSLNAKQTLDSADDEEVERPRTTISFDVGEQVRVSDGPFASLMGTWKADDDKARLKVAVSILVARPL